jgi:DNA-binding transcriptional MerR regulator
VLTISQLASYAGVTVRAVRHYHQIGLLPEAERNGSGYRTYDAAAVVRLIRIRTLAEAGVPLARVQELLDAAPEDFARGIEAIDREVRAEIRRLQANRKRIAGLASGEQLVLPPSVVSYLDRLRALGIDERYIAFERDSWIMIAAQVPDQIDDYIAMKHRELDDPRMERLYFLLSQALDWDEDDPRIVDIADAMEPLMLEAVEAGAVTDDGLDDRFVELLDATALDASPLVQRLIDVFEERGWRGWTRLERVSPGRAPRP